MDKYTSYIARSTVHTCVHVPTALHVQYDRGAEFNLTCSQFAIGCWVLRRHHEIIHDLLHFILICMHDKLWLPD